MELYFATGNQNKFDEAKEILPYIKRFDFRYNEIRSDSLEEIATDAVKSAYSILNKPVFVEDSGLFIEVLNGFPGTYSAWVFKKLGIDGILKLLKGKQNRNALFIACIVFYDGTNLLKFTGKCDGSISRKIMGASGFGYDPIFVPDHAKDTFARNPCLKATLSHRSKALKDFSIFLNKE